MKPWHVAALIGGVWLLSGSVYSLYTKPSVAKIEAAKTLHDEAMYCREAVKNGNKSYGEISRCQQLREFVAIYYAAGKPHDEDRILFYKAQSYAWEAVAISNALYPEQADAVIW